VLFDGHCNLCSSSVQWIIRHDPDRKFRFASLQGEAGLRLKQEFQISPFADSVILIEDNRVFYKSEAALRIARFCAGWKWLWLFRFVPAFMRDGIYNVVARNRYKWFGQKAECWLPSSELESRFLKRQEHFDNNLG
jgi:predicted DCC family thiol-disulfide oxidoreductase YuxK